jgi:SAM-dependent methyltransferase
MAANSLRQRLKHALQPIGIQSSDALWKPLALRAYREKLARDAGYRDWCETVGWRAVHEHWGAHDLAEGEFSRLHLSSQLYEITEMLRRRIGPVGATPVLDAGASDGLFLARIGSSEGVGLNLLEECAAKIAADGYKACVADVERMPFEDRSFPIVICCETLEHVPNPIAALNELARVCAGRIYLTIPWLLRTRISARPAGWPRVESHIFEFSESDFTRVLSHASVNLVYRDQVQVFPEPRNPLTSAWLRLLMYPNFFPRLQYYELEPARQD